VAFDETQRDALRRWYGRDECIEKLRGLAADESWFELEQYVRQDGLMPLVFRDDLPDWLVTEEGKPVFTAADLHPGNNREGWAEAVEIGWGVIEDRLSVKRAEVEGHIDDVAQADWDRWMESIERRKKERGG